MAVLKIRHQLLVQAQECSHPGDSNHLEGSLIMATELQLVADLRTSSNSRDSGTIGTAALLNPVEAIRIARGVAGHQREVQCKVVGIRTRWVL